MGRTVTATVSAADATPDPSVTVSENRKLLPACDGVAVNVRVAPEPVTVTAGPAAWDQAYDVAPTLAAPVRVTVAHGSTPVWSGPAFAVGAAAAVALTD